MRPRAVLWDLDGTLVDSLGHHWRAWRDTLAAHGLTVTYAQFLGSFGQRNDRILRGWLGEATPEATLRRIGEAKEAQYRQLAIQEGVTTLPGAAAWVSRLHAAGWRQAIASSAPKLNVETVARALPFGGLFGALVGAEDVTAGKPDPQIFRLAAERLGVEPARAVVVEDAPAGVEAARRAGMRCVGVAAAALEGADLTVASLADLPDGAFDGLVPQASAAEGAST